VFDNAIIGFGIVDYDESLISGFRLGFAPIEDFAYTWRHSWPFPLPGTC
jgi:hypothetical protein